jgi:hypothetical protein
MTTLSMVRCAAGIALFLVAVPTSGAAQDVDVTAPVLRNFAYSAASIDVSQGSQTITVTAHVTDDLSGVSSVFAQFRSPTGAQSQFANLLVADGTPLDGTFTGGVSFPQFAEAGIWTVTLVRTFDRAGNSMALDTAALDTRGFPTQLSVSSVADTEAPQVLSVAAAPAEIDVSRAPANVTVTLHVTDNLSGSELVPCPSNSFVRGIFPIRWRSPSGAQNRFTTHPTYALVSGTRLDGNWQASFSMPQFSEAGVWTIESVELWDCAGNVRFLNGPQLNALGLQTSVRVLSTPSDIQAPGLTALSYSPITINTSRASQLVTVRLGASDSLSGVDMTPTTPVASFFERGVQFRSPSGNQFATAAFFSQFTLVEGSRENGVWTATVPFAQFAEDGTWRIAFVQIKDAVRNIRSYNTAELEALGFPTRLEVIRPSLTSDGAVTPTGGTITDDTFGDRASVTFPPGAVNEATTVAVDVFLEPLDIPNPTGFIGPGTLFVNIDLTPEPAFPLPPPGLTVVLPVANAMLPGTVLNLFKVDEATGNLVAASNVFGQEVTGTVDANGLSATFTGIASLSTVVGLVPEELSVAIDIKPGAVPNTINLGSRGVLPVAVLSTSTFDAATVDATTVTVANAGPRLRDNGQPMSSLEDVNADGRLDMVVHVETRDLQLTSDSSEAVLRGKTETGMPIVGRDAVRIRP